jgi:hypothetical protein
MQHLRKEYFTTIKILSDFCHKDYKEQIIRYDINIL